MAMVLQCRGEASLCSTAPHPQQDEFCSEELGKLHLRATVAFKSHKNLLKPEDMIFLKILYVFLHFLTSLSLLRTQDEEHENKTVRGENND